MNLHYRNFKGMVPRMDRHLLPDEFAERALDVNLWHGTLRPFREKLLCKEINDDVYTIYHDDCCWRIFDRCVDFAKLHTECGRQAATGIKDYPVTACSKDCEPEWIRLGVPCPGQGPTVSYQGGLKSLAVFTPNFIDSVDYQRISRTYVYTYVNSCGDEGPPSYPSDIVEVDDGQGSVMVTGFNIPAAEYGITHIRLYRSATGFDEKNSGVDNFMIDPREELSGYFLVGEYPISQNIITDSLSDLALGYTLETEGFTEPPKSLTGLIRYGGNAMAGFYDNNKIRFSLPNYPHAWLEEDELLIPDKIMQLVEFNNTLLVLTCGTVYAIEPKQDCKSGGCRQVRKLVENYPFISCCHGYTLTPKGVVFVSAEGLILSDGQNVQNVTSQYFAPDDWKALHPDQMSVAYYRDSLYFFSDVAGYCLQFPVSVQQWDNSVLVELSDRPRWVFSANEQLYFVEKEGIYRWDCANTLRPYLYRTKVAIQPLQVNFAGVKVSRYHGGNLNVKFYGDGLLVKDFDVQRTEKVRLPIGRRDIEFQSEFSGTAELYQVEFSTSYRDLGTL